MTNFDILKRIRKAYWGGDERFQTFLLNLGNWVSNGDIEERWEKEWFSQDEDKQMKLISEIPVMGARGRKERSGTLWNRHLPFDF